jgi:hypothetical protein
MIRRGWLVAITASTVRFNNSPSFRWGMITL